LADGVRERESAAMTITPGTRFGAYEVLSLLGAGGMGEVYRARDPRLGRDVAIKTLRAAASTDPERRVRFEREARAVAALNHPNIVTIYGFEEAEGIPFFTMEYVEGRTLTEKLPPRGLPLDELLRIAIPLTDAVSAAHQHGVLHRDLKPANVMVTTEGRVKVLDFGLAKLKEAVLGSEDAGAGPTAVTTGEGRILGTAAYMSPEQAEGKALDQRSDIFSLGTLLYEMATGQRPFKGDSSVSILSAILRDTPGSVTDLRPDLPRELARIIKHALAKDPERRYQTAKDLRNDLDTLKEDLDSGELARGVVSPARLGIVARHPRIAVGAVLAIVVLVAAGTWWVSRRLTPPPLPAARPFDEFTLKQLTTEPISDEAVAVSPDGRYVAYAFVEAGRQGLRVRQVETSATVQVVPPDEVAYNGVAFTPDGNRLYYSAYPKKATPATLYEVSVLGGTPRRLVEDVDSTVTFSPDATRFAFMRGLPTVGVALVTANADGTGERVLVVRRDAFIVSACAWSPDGRTIAAAAYDQGARIAIFAVDATTGAVTPIGSKQWDEVESLAWEQDGRALIIAAMDRAVADAMQVWEVSVQEGSSRRITTDIAGYRRVAFTADGRTLVALRSEWRGTLWTGPSAQLDRVERIASVPDRVSSHWRIGWTPDGRILHTATVSGNPDVWTVRPDGSDLRQLTTSPGSDRAAVAAADGRYIVFLSDRDGRDRVWRMEPDGGRQTPLTEGPEDHHPVVAGDSKYVYFSRYGQEPGPPEAFYMVPIDGGKPAPVSAGAWARVPAGFWPGATSPDGSLLFGTSWDLEQGGVRVYVVSTSGQGALGKLAMGVAYDTDYMLSWAPDGRAITFTTTTDGTSNLWRQPLDGGPATRLTNYTSGEEIVSHAWSPDGKWLAMVRGKAESHVVMLRDVGRGR
jgi:Tol biopolymer transport system component/predicted Ser/Thr protein kinase